MSETTGSKRRPSPLGDAANDDSLPPEKRHLSSASLAENISEWQAYGGDNILDRLLLTKRCITLPEDDLTTFISGFLFQETEPEDHQSFNRYRKTLDRCMNFDVTDAVTEVQSILYQYGGYDRSAASSTKTSYEVDDIFSDLEKCYLSLENKMPGRLDEHGLGHLVKYCHYAMDFIGAATKILMSPTVWQEPAYKDLFRLFSRLAGLQLQDAAFEAPRHFHMLGEAISGRPCLRAHVLLDRENWWRQKPVYSHMPTKQILSAVVLVKLSPPNTCRQKQCMVAEGKQEAETEEHLGELVGAMLAELLADEPIVTSERTRMLGILVLSTKVYFVKLLIPKSLRDWYRNPASSSMDRGVEEGTVYVTQGFDYMKRRPRRQLLKILHKISTIRSDVY